MSTTVTPVVADITKDALKSSPKEEKTQSLKEEKQIDAHLNGDSENDEVFPSDLSRILSEVARCGHSSTLPWSEWKGSRSRSEPPRKRKNGLKRSHSSTSSSSDRENEDGVLLYDRYSSLKEALAHALILILDRSFKRSGYKPSPAEKKRCEMALKKQPNSTTTAASNDKTSQNKGPISELAFRERRDRLLSMLGGNTIRNFQRSRFYSRHHSHNQAKRKRVYREAFCSGSGSPPFTIQRVAEVLSTPERYYTQTHKLCNGLEKLLLVTSTSNAFGGSSGGEVTQRLDEEREIKLLANERGREHQLRRFKRRSSSISSSSAPPTESGSSGKDVNGSNGISASSSSPPETSQVQQNFMSDSLDDAEDGNAETPSCSRLFCSPPYDYNESNSTSDVVAVTAASAQMAYSLKVSPSQTKALPDSSSEKTTEQRQKQDDGKEQEEQNTASSRTSNGFLLRSRGDAEKEKDSSGKVPTNGFLKINGDGGSSFSRYFSKEEQPPEADSMPSILTQSTGKSSEYNTLLDGATSSPLPNTFSEQTTTPPMVALLSSSTLNSCGTHPKSSLRLSEVIGGDSIDESSPAGLIQIARAPSPVLYSTRPNYSAVGGVTSEQLSLGFQPSTEQMNFELDSAPAAVTVGSAPVAATDVTDLEVEPGRSSASTSDSESGDDVDDSASDRSDGSDSGGYNEPFTAARLMALNRMQQQQRREQFLQSRALAAVAAAGDFRPPPDSEYQSGDSIDSTRAEDSGGSDSSSSDMAD